MNALRRVAANWWADLKERHWFRAHSLYRGMALEAHARSVEFAVENLTGARRFADRDELLRFCVRTSAECEAPDGILAEFGVWKGQSLAVIAQAGGGSPVVGFDSFEGLPEDWGAVLPKEFFRVAGLPPVASNVRLVKGWFRDTLPGFLAEDRRPFRFIHLDADLYSSTRDVLEAARGRLVPGTVIIFDELLNVVDWEKNEYRALKEHLIDRGVPFTYLAFHSEATLGSGSAVAIRLNASA